MMKSLTKFLNSPSADYTQTPIPAKVLRVLHIIIIVLSVFLVLYNLDAYPAISGWDEGIFLQFAQNLAHHGELATRNGITFEQLNPTISVGPTLIVPVSLMISIFGNNLLAVRLVAAVYLLCATAGVYFLITALFDRKAGLLAVVLFLIAGYGTSNTLWLGRQVIGEAPAFAFLFWGLWAWVKSLQQNNNWRLLAISAILTAMAVITKGQLLLLVAPVFLLIAFLDMVYYRCLNWPARLLPLAAIFAGYVSWWVIILPLLADPVHRAIFLENQSSMTRALLTVNYQRVYMNLSYLYRSGQWWVLLAVPYILWLSRERSVQGISRSFLPLLAGVSLAMYIFLLVNWARYVHFPLAISAICAAVMITDIIARLRLHYSLKPVTSVALWVVVVLIVTGPYIAPKVELITTTNDTTAEEFSSIIEEHVPPDEHIVSWEWELDFFSNRLFLRPDYALFSAVFDFYYNHRYDPILEKSRIPENAKYFIVGADTIVMWAAEMEKRSYQTVAELGKYTLYQLD